MLVLVVVSCWVMSDSFVPPAEPLFWALESRPSCNGPTAPACFQAPSFCACACWTLLSTPFPLWMVLPSAPCASSPARVLPLPSSRFSPTSNPTQRALLVSSPRWLSNPSLQLVYAPSSSTISLVLATGLTLLPSSSFFKPQPGGSFQKQNLITPSPLLKIL